MFRRTWGGRRSRIAQLTPHRNLSWGGASGEWGLGAGALLQGLKHWEVETSNRGRWPGDAPGPCPGVGLKASFSPRSLGLLLASLGRRPHVKGTRNLVGSRL